MASELDPSPTQPAPSSPTFAAVPVEEIPESLETFAALGVAAAAANSALTPLEFKGLDTDEFERLEIFYNATVAIVDFSEPCRRPVLAYHLGIRKHEGRKGCLLLYHEEEDAKHQPFSAQYVNSKHILEALSEWDKNQAKYIPNDDVVVVPYRKVDDVMCCIPPGNDSPVPLSDVIWPIATGIASRELVNFKEVFLRDLSRARKRLGRNDLFEALRELRRRLDSDARLYSVDVLRELFAAWRDVDDYDMIVETFDTTPDPVCNDPSIQYLNAFALNRRNSAGDREKALNIMEKVVKDPKGKTTDNLCLIGRIHKDYFTDSSYSDEEHLKNAVFWYEQAYLAEPSLYAGINLATLIVVSGNNIKHSAQLQKICMMLNFEVGKVGTLNTTNDFWNIATLFEIKILTENFAKANQIAEKMFLLKPPSWYLKTTLNNITLIQSAHQKDTSATSNDPDLVKLDFWLDFLKAMAYSKTDFMKIPVLSVEEVRRSGGKTEHGQLAPMYLSIQETTYDGDDPFLHIYYSSDFSVLSGNIVDFLYRVPGIRRLVLHERDDRSMSMFLRENMEDFQLFFPREDIRGRCHARLLELGIEKAEDTDQETRVNIKFEFQRGRDGNRKVLGKGTFGTVYEAKDVKNNRKMAVKEIAQTYNDQVEPLHEEIRLHCHFHHPNIVRYYGSMSEAGSDGDCLYIFMELVPGGSLAHMLRKIGALTDMGLVASYTSQICEGLRYLHGNHVVHRDIKGDNVLVNMYTGILKISDFGATKRVSQVSPRIATFAGTMRFMAPEVINGGPRGYGSRADVWSMGCTVVEMLSGRPPFIELGSPEAAIYRVGIHGVHPPIPDVASDECRAMLKRCFDADQNSRASCTELLQTPFLIEGKQKARQKKEEAKTGSEAGTYDDPSPCSASVGDVVASVGDVVANSNDSETDTLHAQQRHHVQNIREQKLVEILSEHADSISGQWHNKYVSKFSTDAKPRISRRTLHSVLLALQSYIKSWNFEELKESMKKYRQPVLTEEKIAEIDRWINSKVVENKVLNESMETALLLFPDIATQAMTENNIKPHWLFSLDNCVRIALAAAIDSIRLWPPGEPSPLSGSVGSNTTFWDNRNPFDVAALKALEEMKESAGRAGSESEACQASTKDSIEDGGVISPSPPNFTTANRRETTANTANPVVSGNHEYSCSNRTSGSPTIAERTGAVFRRSIGRTTEYHGDDDGDTARCRGDVAMHTSKKVTWATDQIVDEGVGVSIGHSSSTSAFNTLLSHELQGHQARMYRLLSSQAAVSPSSGLAPVDTDLLFAAGESPAKDIQPHPFADGGVAGVIGEHTEREDADGDCDPEVRHWLTPLNVDQDVIHAFGRHQVTLLDLRHCMTRSDMADMQLKIGPRCRIWHKLCKERRRQQLDQPVTDHHSQEHKQHGNGGNGDCQCACRHNRSHDTD